MKNVSLVHRFVNNLRLPSMCLLLKLKRNRTLMKGLLYYKFIRQTKADLVLTKS